TVVSAFVRVGIPAGTNVAQPFVRLEVESASNPTGYSGGTSPNVNFNLGQAVAPNQTIQVGAFSAFGGTVVGNTTTFNLPLANLARLNYALTALKAGTYQISLAFAGASNNWTAGFAPGGVNQTKVFTQTVNGDDSGEQIFIGGSN